VWWYPGIEEREEGAGGDDATEATERGELYGGELGASPHEEDYRSVVEGPGIKWWVYELIFCGWVGGYGDVGGGDSGGVA
jgi:hypothetical protein